jgi:hypothetical protein
MFNEREDNFGERRKMMTRFNIEKDNIGKLNRRIQMICTILILTIISLACGIGSENELSQAKATQAAADATSVSASIIMATLNAAETDKVSRVETPGSTPTQTSQITQSPVLLRSSPTVETPTASLSPTVEALTSTVSLTALHRTQSNENRIATQTSRSATRIKGMPGTLTAFPQTATIRVPTLLTHGTSHAQEALVMNESAGVLITFSREPYWQWREDREITERHWKMDIAFEEVLGRPITITRRRVDIYTVKPGGYYDIDNITISIAANGKATDDWGVYCKPTTCDGSMLLFRYDAQDVRGNEYELKAVTNLLP